MGDFNWVNDIVCFVLKYDTEYSIDTTTTGFYEPSVRSKINNLVGEGWSTHGDCYNSYVNWFSNENISGLGNKVYLTFVLTTNVPYIKTGWDVKPNRIKVGIEISMDEFLNSVIL
jgi:hypothetical protein